MSIEDKLTRRTFGLGLIGLPLIANTQAIASATLPYGISEPSVPDDRVGKIKTIKRHMEQINKWFPPYGNVKNLTYEALGRELEILSGKRTREEPLDSYLLRLFSNELDSARGKTDVFIDLSLTSCPPCVEHYPPLVKLAVQHQVRPILVLMDGDMVERNIWKDVLKKIGVDEYDINYSHPEGGFPSYFVIGKDGTLFNRLKVFDPESAQRMIAPGSKIGLADSEEEYARNVMLYRKLLGDSRYRDSMRVNTVNVLVDGSTQYIPIGIGDLFRTIAKNFEISIPSSLSSWSPGAPIWIDKEYKSYADMLDELIRHNPHWAVIEDLKKFRKDLQESGKEDRVPVSLRTVSALTDETNTHHPMWNSDYLFRLVQSTNGVLVEADFSTDMLDFGYYGRNINSLLNVVYENFVTRYGLYRFRMESGESGKPVIRLQQKYRPV